MKCSICEKRSSKLTTVTLNNDRICDRCLSELMEGESESEDSESELGLNLAEASSNTPHSTVVRKETDRVPNDQVHDHLKTPLEDSHDNGDLERFKDHPELEDSITNKVVAKFKDEVADPVIDDHLEQCFEDEIKCEESRLADSVPMEDCISVDNPDISNKTPVIKEEIIDSVIDDHLNVPLEDEIKCADTHLIGSSDVDPTNDRHKMDIEDEIKHEKIQPENDKIEHDHDSVDQSDKTEIFLDSDNKNNTGTEIVETGLNIIEEDDKYNDEDVIKNIESTAGNAIEVEVKDEITIEETRLALDSHELNEKQDESTAEQTKTVEGSSINKSETISTELQDQLVAKLATNKVKGKDMKCENNNTSTKRVSKRLENRKVTNNDSENKCSNENDDPQDYVPCKKNVEAQKSEALKNRDRIKVTPTENSHFAKKPSSKKESVDHDKLSAKKRSISEVKISKTTGDDIEDHFSKPVPKRSRKADHSQKVTNVKPSEGYDHVEKKSTSKKRRRSEIKVSKTSEDHLEDHSRKSVPKRSRRADHGKMIKNVESIEGDHRIASPAVDDRSRPDRQRKGLSKKGSELHKHPPVASKRSIQRRRTVELNKVQEIEDDIDHSESSKLGEPRRSDRKRSKPKPSKLDDQVEGDSSKSTICRLCGFEGVTPRSIRSHMVKKHGVENLNRCQICYHFFKGDKLFEDHIRDEHQGLYRICKICLQGYGKGEDETHATNCPGRKIFECSTCKVRYVKKEAIWKHLDTHEIPDDQKDAANSEITIKEAFLTCVVCEDDRAFGEADHKDHVQQDHKGHHIRCPECRRTFRLRASYINHRRRVCKNNFKDLGTSTAFKPIASKCPYCGNFYDNRMKLQDHVKKIHEAKTLKCNICGAEKVGHRALRYHKLKIHSEPQHACSLCKKKFHILAHRDRHEALHQTEGKRLCEQCGRVYHDSKALEMHIRVLHHKGLPRYRRPKDQLEEKETAKTQKKK